MHFDLLNSYNYEKRLDRFTLRKTHEIEQRKGRECLDTFGELLEIMGQYLGAQL